MTDEAAATKTARTAAAKAKEPELNIFQRINAISLEAGALAPESKGGVPFAFRGIDGTVAHLTPFLHKYGVFAAPKVLEAKVRDREVGSRVVKTTEVVVEYTFYGPDGSSVTTVSAGLADDFADRSTAQAMSVAYRIALLQLFHLPTHSKEPEETGQEVLDGAAAEPKQPKAVAAAKAATSAPTGPNIGRLQQECKALGRALNMAPDDLNRLGEQISGGKKAEEWFNDAFVMEQLRDRLKAEQGGTAGA